ncbi:MAG: NCS2 family permease [Clostridium sp.]|nr:NCS2 family permease [Clostridium sp.]
MLNSQQNNGGSFLDSYFKLSENNTNVKTEIIAGFTTFIAMSYIIFVNPSVLKLTGMNPNGVFVATCIAAAVGTLIMALYANLPFAQAPGMGLNAFFTYTVVLTMHYTWQEGLAAVFISGILFIIITLTSIREKIVEAIPQTLKLAISGGIGLFIAIIGLKNGGIVVANSDTLVSFGKLIEPGPALTLIGLLITCVLMARKVKGSMLIGILITTVIGIPMKITQPVALNQLVSLPKGWSTTFMKMDFSGLLDAKGGITAAITSLIMVVVTICLVDLFDTLGTLVGTAEKANMLDENGQVKNLPKALICDAVATTAGSIFGTSTVVTYVESTSGVSEGGRTGLTSFVVGILFIFALLFSGLVGMVPTQATAPALIIVGVLMMSSVTKINFDDFTDAVPAFLTIAMMPFTYSIANGIACGLISYPIMKVATGQGKKVHPLVYILAVIFIIRFTLLPQ